MKLAKYTSVILIGLALVVANCSPKERALPCSKDSECASDQICLEGQCTLVACKSDQDCQATEACIDHECVKNTGCTTDGQCQIGQICKSGECLTGCR
ncbi:MAG: hypothetical protein JRJ19_08950, partial [Deltaproteobacteria bacterium]|nr:hypothetical protein [Deltaproteobacteria bacterium]